MIAFDGRRSRDVANRDDRFGYPVGARGTTALDHMEVVVRPDWWSWSVPYAMRGV
jgi:hypothetical protein